MLPSCHILCNRDTLLLSNSHVNEQTFLCVQNNYIQVTNAESIQQLQQKEHLVLVCRRTTKSCHCTFLSRAWYCCCFSVLPSFRRAKSSAHMPSRLSTCKQQIQCCSAELIMQPTVRAKLGTAAAALYCLPSGEPSHLHTCPAGSLSVDTHRMVISRR